MYSVVIVDYNTICLTMEYIEKCLQSILCKEKLHFVIIDNLPDSRSVDIIAKEYNKDISDISNEKWKIYQISHEKTEIILVCTGKNLGYAKGNNIGIEISADLWEDEYLIITNNDIDFPYSLEIYNMRKVIEDNKDVAIVGPHIVDSYGREQGPYSEKSAWELLFKQNMYILPELIFGFHWKGMTDYDGMSRRCYWVSGCFMLASRKRLEQCGNFDENTFLYAEEMILSERLKRKGYCQYFYNDLKVVHFSSQTIDKVFKNLEAYEEIFKSQVYYFRKYKNSNRIVLLLAKIHFKIVKGLFYTMRFIRRTLSPKKNNG